MAVTEPPNSGAPCSHTNCVAEGSIWTQEGGCGKLCNDGSHNCAEACSRSGLYVVVTLRYVGLCMNVRAIVPVFV